MSKEVLTLAVVDGDSPSAGSGSSRAGFLKAAVVAGGTFVAGGVLIGGLPKLSIGAPSAAQDAKILNFALTLEFLEAEFYTRAEENGRLRGELAEFASTVGAHERAHVEFLQGALGDAAVAKPQFNFGNTVRNPQAFAKTAQVLEDTGVAAYNGQAPNLTKETLGPAASIVAVEALHAGWIRDINRGNPAPAALDEAKSMQQILAAVKETGFIRS
jgi:hypothetical protein